MSVLTVCFTVRHILFFTGPMQFIIYGVLISRIHHGSRCSCRMHKYSISTILIPESYHLYAAWRCTCLGSWAPCWRWQFLSAAWSRVKGQPISPLTWLVQIKSASRRSLAVARYHWRLLELRPHRATAGQRGQPSMLITVCADLSSFEYLKCQSVRSLLLVKGHFSYFSEVIQSLLLRNKLNYM